MGVIRVLLYALAISAASDSGYLVNSKQDRSRRPLVFGVISSLIIVIIFFLEGHF